MDASPPASPLIDVAGARNIALKQVAPVGTMCDLPLAAALGRICARDVIATGAMPFFTNSAMDGFAVRAADLANALALPVAGTVAAGAGEPAPFVPGTAQRIFTGAALPAGSDTVIPLEEATAAGGTVSFAARPETGANIRLVGSDQPAGACLVARGTPIAPQHLGLMAANGSARVAVVRRPRVAVLSTGDELAASGEPRHGGQVHDANRPMLLALAQAAGCETVDAGILPDAIDPLARRLAELSSTADLILSSGGASMGGRDPLRPAFAAAGGEMACWRVAVKPGKPVMFGRIGDAAVTGLPGNPMAAFVGFHLFVLPQIARLTGRTPAPFAASRGRAAFSWRRKPGRQEVFPVRCLGTDPTGLPLLQRLGNGVSATLFPLAGAEGLATVPAQSDGVAEGELLCWQKFCAGR